MAKKVWTGANNTSFNDTGNWSPSGVPVDGDSLYFMDATVNACTTDMNRTATDNISFALVHIGPRYNRDLGTAADPLRAGIDELFMQGPSTAYIRANDNATTHQPIDNIVQKAGSLKLDLRGTAVQTTLLIIENGLCTLQDGRIVSVRCTGNVTLEILAAMDLLTNLDIDRGQVVSDATVHDVINLGAASLILQGAAAVTTGSAKITNRAGIVRYKSSGDITNVDLHRGASVLVNGNDNEGPMTIALLRNFGGFLDLRNTTRNVVVTTLENHDGDSSWGIPARTKVTLADI